MLANDTQRLALTAVVKGWWKRTRNFFRIRKTTSQTDKFEPQGTNSNAIQPKEDIVHFGEDIVVAKEGIHRLDEDLGHQEGSVGDNEEDLVYRKGDRLIKDISVFHTGTSDDFVPRSCILDSAAPVNLISEAAVRGIQCNIKPGNGEVSGLGSLIFPVIGTVMLRFMFWDRGEIFEVEFHVLKSRQFFDEKLDPGFDCLLCWNWMKTHPHAWDSVLARAK